MNIEIYDIIIVGAGMAGLYAGYNIKKNYPNKKFLILEKNPKKWIGGRAGNDTFYNTNIVTGAGIGRKLKDKLLFDLVTDLGVKTNEFEVKPAYSKKLQESYRVDILEIMDKLRKEYSKLDNSSPLKHTTFSNFAKSILQDDLYNKFVISSGYSDYENEDVANTLYYYGMEDNACCWKSFGLSWKELVTKLCEYIGPSNIIASSPVVSISRVKDDPCIFMITVQNNNKKTTYFTRKVIIATTIESIRNLLPKYPIYNEIESQPFLRLYGKFNEKSTGIMKKLVPGYMFLTRPLQKIIPMDSDKGVYMISYNDNKNSILLKNYLSNNDTNRNMFARLLEKAFGLEPNTLELIEIKDYYWDAGTHYFKPLDNSTYQSREQFIKQAQHPEKGILVVGEVVSLNQGWVEGALSSVSKVLDKKWIDSIC